MVIANHLLCNNRQLGGNLSFRRGNTWISEVDTCLAKLGCIDQITQVETNQDIIGSNHAPLSVTVPIPSATVTNIDILIKRSEMLGQTHIHRNDTQKLTKTPSHRNIDLEQLTRTLQSLVPPIIDNPVELPDVVDAGFCTIMDTALTCRTDTPNTNWDETRPRWALILESQEV